MTDGTAPSARIACGSDKGDAANAGKAVDKALEAGRIQIPARRDRIERREPPGFPPALAERGLLQPPHTYKRLPIADAR